MPTLPSSSSAVRARGGDRRGRGIDPECNEAEPGQRHRVPPGAAPEIEDGREGQP